MSLSLKGYGISCVRAPRHSKENFELVIIKYSFCLHREKKWIVRQVYKKKITTKMQVCFANKKTPGVDNIYI